MNVLDLVGRTPLLSLDRIAQATPGLPEGIRILAKAEFLNPSGSVKDRAARAMFLEGIETGELTKGKTLVDATSGNTGISYAMLGAALGYKVTLCLPANANGERKAILRAYGADIMETDPLESSDGSYLAARDLARAEPDRFFFPDQYNNPANPLAHYQSTAPEIWEDSKGEVDYFVCGMGTSGTFMGTSRRLKELKPSLKAVAIQPDSPMHGIEGTKHMASTIVPGIYQASLIDSHILVSTDEAYLNVRRLAREEGLLVGVSSGANLAGALKLARTLSPGQVVVTVLGDTGSRYLSDGVL
jgi:cysteine synthase B